MFDRHARWARRIGYEISERLDETGSGFTYLARHVAINRTVRLKLSVGLVGSPSQAALRREADAMAGLEHPNVIRLNDYGEQFGQPYLVLEHIEGSEPRRPPMPTRQTAEVAMMLAIGLQAVHEHGVVHGGLQTEAVILTRDGTPKIDNFAAAWRKDHPQDAAGWPEWVRPHFQALEVRAGELARIGPASDLYALGAILHELLTGEPPAPGICPAPPHGADPAFGMIVLKCLEPEPERRFRSAGELALAVQLFLDPRKLDPQGSSDNSAATIMTSAVESTDRSARYRLRVTSGPQAIGHTVDVPRYRVMIGRVKGNTVVLPGRDVSRNHCGIRWNAAEGCHELVDLGAKNGTWVNAHRVTDTRRLAAGDEIRIANYTLLFELLPAGTA